MRKPYEPGSRKGIGGRPRAVLGDAFSLALVRQIQHRASNVWPSPEWQADPIGFAEKICGVQLWSFQREMLEAIRDNRHVAIAGGRKIGKDFGVAIASLWWFASWPDARVLLLAPTSKQLDGIVYREIRMLWSQSGRCLKCKTDDPDGPRPCEHSAVLTGSVGMMARTGIRSEDFREIIGQTAISEGGLRGMSGARILAIEDEASDIKDEFDTALVGNLAGVDCHRVIISNPTRTQGFFYRAFHEERHLYETLQVSTETNPNIVEGKEVVRGLATREWIAERETAWGRGSANWSANVEGKFVTAEEGQLFDVESISAAENRWDEALDAGRLVIGIDVAGESQDGDESAFALRRARKVLGIFTFRGLTPDAHLAKLRGFIKENRRPDDTGDAEPLVVVDRDGQIGARVYDAISAYRRRDATTEREFRLIGFRGSAPPLGRLADTYRLSRDALFGGLVDAFREGLAIPSDVKLEGELVSLRWVDGERGKSRLVQKSELRDRLGRSPDRLDALALCTWGERRVGPTTAAALPVVRVQSAEGLRYGGGLDPNVGGLDPYGGIDPYATGQ